MARRSKYTDEYIDSFIKNNELKIKRIGSFNYDERTVTFQCSICNYIWDKDPILIIKKLRGCAQCACRLKITNKIIDERLINRTISRLGDVGKNTKENIEFLCNNCNYIWEACPYNVMHKESNCPKCTNHLALTNEIVDRKLIDSQRKIKRIGEIECSRNYCMWLCLDCNKEWSAKVASILNQGTGCPKCSKSIGEKNINNILENFGIEFVTNYNIYIYGFINDERPKLIDFYLPYYNLFIEYNGEQHYRPIRFGGCSLQEANDNFEKQLTRDKEVRDFAKKNNIKIFEIDARNFKNKKNLYSDLESYIYYELSNIETHERSMGRILGYPPEKYPTYEEVLHIMGWNLNE